MSAPANTLPPPSLSPELAALLVRVRPALASEPVDELQTAAFLESSGITDDEARTTYGYDDVFSLAHEVQRRLVEPQLSARSPLDFSRRGRRWRRAGEPASRVVVLRIPERRTPGVTASRSHVRVVMHGPLYLMPAAIFPLAFRALSGPGLIACVALAAALGWVWAAGTSFLAYRRASAGRARSAALVLLLGALSGVVAGAVLGWGVASETSGTGALVVMAAAQLAYQMTATTLAYYGAELWLCVLLPPALLLLAVPQLTDDRFVVSSAVAGGALVFAAFVVSCLVAVRDVRHRSDVVLHHQGVGFATWWRMPHGLTMSSAYAALSAAYLLTAQVPYLTSEPAVIIAMVPMMLAMGVVEWRAFGFPDRARTLMSRSLDRKSFGRRVRRLLARELVLVLGTTGVLLAALAEVMRSRGSLTPQAALMGGAGVLLAGVFFLGFVVSTTGRYGRLCAALAVCLGARVAVEMGTSRPLNAVEDTSVFLGGTAVLLVLFLFGLWGWVSQPWAHK